MTRPDHDIYSHAPPQEVPIEVPMDALSEDVLDSVIGSFVLREGTDYGEVEIGLDRKVQAVRKQLERGDVKLVFDATTESVTFMTKVEWQRRQK